jgi:hypothetical protein
MFFQKQHNRGCCAWDKHGQKRLVPNTQTKREVNTGDIGRMTLLASLAHINSATGDKRGGT